MARYACILHAAFALAVMPWAQGARVDHGAGRAGRAGPRPPFVWKSTSATQLQQILLQKLMAEEVPEMQGPKLEVSLKELVGTVRGAWAEGGTSGCFQQLGSMIANLTAACHEQKPQDKELFVFRYYKPPLPKKTCKESVDDIFVHGRALAAAMQTSKEDLASLKVDRSTVAMVHSLYFLQAWLTPLAYTQSDALLWAGFWDADPRNRTTSETLHDFATATDHATVHPDSWLGQVIDRSNDLSDCYTEDMSQLMANMWTMVSVSFVLGMMERGQGTVVALVNKGMEGERPLEKAVLYEHEIPTLGLATYGLGYWSPQVLLIDLQGTCSQTSPALQQQLSSRLGPWAKSKQKQHWRLEDFVQRSRLRWRCLDCVNPACNLDNSLAKELKQQVWKKQLKDQNGQWLLRILKKSKNGMMDEASRQACMGPNEAMEVSWGSVFE